MSTDPGMEDRSRPSLTAEYRLNILATYIQQAAGLLHAFLAPVIAMRIWGQDLYGLWLLTTSYLAYLSLGATLGMDNAAFVLIGQRRSRIERARIHARISILLTGLAALLAILYLGGSRMVPDWPRLLGRIPSELDGVATRIGNTTILSFLIAMPLSSATGVLSGIGKQHWRSLIDASISALSLAAIAVCALFHCGITTFVFAFFCFQIVASVVRFLLVRSVLEKSPERVPGDPTSSWGDIFRCALPSLVGTLAGMGLPMVETFALGRFFPLGTVAIYVLASRLVNLAFSFCMSINIALGASIARAYREGRDVPRLVERFESRSMAVGSLVATGIVLFADPFIRFWLGGATRPSQSIVLCLALYGLLYLRTNLFTVILNAGNRILHLATVLWMELGVKTLALFALVSQLGLLALPVAGIVSSASIPNILLPTALRRSRSRDLRSMRRFLPALTAVFAAQAIASSGVEWVRWTAGTALLALMAAIAYKEWKQEVEW